MIDLDDLLLFWRALARDDVIGPRLAASFDHVLIDEYQDVNGLQVDLARVDGRVRLRDHRGRRRLPGDLRLPLGVGGAHPRLPGALPGHARGHAGAQLPLHAAGAGRGQRGRRAGDAGVPEDACVADRPGGVRPRVVHVRDESAQAEEVCNRILEARENGSDLRDQAVLMRTSHDSDLLELELTRRRIPFHKYGGLRYLEAAHVKDFLAMLRLADNGADDVAWFRVLQLVEGLGPASARRAIAAMAAAASGRSARDEAARRLRRRRTGSPRGPARGSACPSRRARARTRVIAALVARARGAAARAAGRDPARGARAARAPALSRRGAARCRTSSQLVAAAHEARDPRHFVAELVLDPPQSSADIAQPPHLDEDYLTISTIHCAKGLEWDSVHVLAVYDGNFPACMAAGTSESIDEERRLLYVGMTRARRTLSLYVPVRYHHRPRGNDDAHGYGKPSRFLTPEVLAACDVTRLPDDPLNPYGAPIVTRRRISVTPDSLFD